MAESSSSALPGGVEWLPTLGGAHLLRADVRGAPPVLVLHSTQGDEQRIEPGPQARFDGTTTYMVPAGIMWSRASLAWPDGTRAVLSSQAERDRAAAPTGGDVAAAAAARCRGPRHPSQAGRRSSRSRLGRGGAGARDGDARGLEAERAARRRARETRWPRHSRAARAARESRRARDAPTELARRAAPSAGSAPTPAPTSRARVATPRWPAPRWRRCAPTSRPSAPPAPAPRPHRPSARPSSRTRDVEACAARSALERRAREQAEAAAAASAAAAPLRAGRAARRPRRGRRHLRAATTARPRGHRRRVRRRRGADRRRAVVGFAPTALVPRPAPATRCLRLRARLRLARARTRVAAGDAARRSAARAGRGARGDADVRPHGPRRRDVRGLRRATARRACSGSRGAAPAARPRSTSRASRSRSPSCSPASERKVRRFARGGAGLRPPQARRGRSRALPAARLSLADAVRAGARLEPALVYRALPFAIAARVDTRPRVHGRPGDRRARAHAPGTSRPATASRCASSSTPPARPPTRR